MILLIKLLSQSLKYSLINSPGFSYLPTLYFKDMSSKASRLAILLAFM